MSNNITILNLTQHQATPEQVAQGVVEPSIENKEDIKLLLTFDSLFDTDYDQMVNRAVTLATICVREGCSKAMIGGAPFFMAPLETALRERGVKPLYAFSVRESVEQSQPDGSVRKTNVFKHVGFVGDI